MSILPSLFVSVGIFRTDLLFRLQTDIEWLACTYQTLQVKKYGAKRFFLFNGFYSIWPMMCCNIHAAQNEKSERKNGGERTFCRCECAPPAAILHLNTADCDSRMQYSAAFVRIARYSFRYCVVSCHYASSITDLFLN